MTEPDDPKRCPKCGSAVTAGASVLLCAVCVLSDTPEDADEVPDGQRIGTYTLLDEIARGGMGVVYRARQERLNRIVALKVLPGAAFASAEFRARFQREAETVARLKHPGIVAVHEIGEALGQPFLSMDFIEGSSLAEKLMESRMPVAFAAHLVREVARAVEHAHRQGVAHRDLKPSNILIRGDNQPVLTDFGLARFLDDESSRGLTMDLMGSPPYLPPERVNGGSHDDPVAEDVYGLGAVLYHCLTGRPPFVADSLNALLAAVGEGDPVAPRRLNSSVPQDLETICLRCLEKSPAARYRTAAEVADELDRFLRGEPILARPLSPAELVIRAIRRKPVISSLVLALMLAVVSGTMVSVIGWRSAASNAADYRNIAEKRRIDLYSANLSAASAAMESGNRNQARELLAQGRSTGGETDLRGCEWFLMEQLLRSRELVSIKAHDHILTALAWHPEGELLLSGAHDGSLRSWKRSGAGTLLPGDEIIPPGNGIIWQIQWLPGGGTFLAAEGGTIRCRKPGVKQALWEIPGCQFSLTSDGLALAVSTGGMFFYEAPGRISLWNLHPEVSNPPELRRTLPDPARAVALSPDARWLAAGLPRHGHHDEERDLDLFDLTAPGAPPRHLETRGSILHLEFSPDSDRLVATTQTGKPALHLFDLLSGREPVLPQPHSARIWSACFTSDSRSLFTTSSDRSLCLTTMDGSRPPQKLPLAHDNEIWASAIHPSGAFVATGDKDGILKIHALPLPGPPVGGFPRHPHFRYARPVFSPDSSALYVCETQPAWKTFTWSPEDGLREGTGLTFYPSCIAPDGTLAWRDIDTRRVMLQKRGASPVTAGMPPLSWPETPSMHNHGSTTDGRHLYQFSESGHAATLDLVSGGVRSINGFCQKQPTASALSPGGRFLVAATWQELVIHDFSTGKTTRQSNDPHWAKTIVFSPDGSLMASGGNDGHILLRRTTDFAIIWKLRGHLSEVSGLAISPDGRTIVSSEIGSGLRFWRLDTRREVLRLPLRDVCESLVFSPDGSKLAVTTCPPASPPEAGQILLIPCPRAE